MNFLTKRLAILIFCLVSAQICFSQGGSNNIIVENLRKSLPDHPQEQVYLHFNKANYLTGDDIWFKAYLTIGMQNRLSALSGVLYVDLIGLKNKTVKKLRLPIMSGISMGDIRLADSLDEGTYRIRAYTNWMRNFPEETFFNKVFTVGKITPDPLIASSNFAYNSESKKLLSDLVLKSDVGLPISNSAVEYTLTLGDKESGNGRGKTDAEGRLSFEFQNNKNIPINKGILTLIVTQPNKKLYSKNIPINISPTENRIKFMPEGGDLVAGLESRVAFKILQPNGLAGKGTGHIVDDQGTTISSFTSGHGGMGSFNLRPEPGKRYKAVVSLNGEKPQTLNLPEIKTEGFVLTLNQSMASSVFLAIAASPSMIKNQKATILVHKDGEILYLAEKIINAPASVNKLSVANYPTGILQITLLDESMRPLAERLFFNFNKKSILPLTVITNKENYGPRQPVVVKLNAGASGDSLRVGSFSASVNNLAVNLPVPANSTSILAGLLLQPELKGHVENPDYYFENYNAEKQKELDDLILSQAWRRIIWNNVLAGKKAEFIHKPENGFTVRGSVTKPNGDLVPNARITLLSTKNWASMDTVSDIAGNFVFDRLFLRDSSEFSIQAKDANGKKNLVIKVNPTTEQANSLSMDHYSPENELSGDGYRAFIKHNYDKNVPDSVKRRLLSSNNLMSEVVIKASKPSKAPNSSNLNGPGVADQVFSAEEMENSVTLKQFLEGRAMGIRFNNDTAVSSRNGEAIRIIIDGMTMTPDDNSLTTMSVADVQSVEILRNTALTFLYGTNTGIIIITTKTGQGARRKNIPSPDNQSIVLVGFNAMREFYSPDYSIAVTNTRIPDHRSAIFWKPDLITDKDGNTSFQFFTSDDKGEYEVEVQGMTADGRMSYLKKTIKVGL